MFIGKLLNLAGFPGFVWDCEHQEAATDAAIDLIAMSSERDASANIMRRPTADRSSDSGCCSAKAGRCSRL
jgi:hypothetical protein